MQFTKAEEYGMFGVLYLAENNSSRVVPLSEISQAKDIPEKFPDSPYLAEALLERGWARQKLIQVDEARKDFERAATLSRTDIGARARFLMGESYFQQKQYKRIHYLLLAY